MSFLTNVVQVVGDGARVRTSRRRDGIVARSRPDARDCAFDGVAGDGRATKACVLAFLVLLFARRPRVSHVRGDYPMRVARSERAMFRVHFRLRVSNFVRVAVLFVFKAVEAKTSETRYGHASAIDSPGVRLLTMEHCDLIPVYVRGSPRRADNCVLFLSSFGRAARFKYRFRRLHVEAIWWLLVYFLRSLPGDDVRRQDRVAYQDGKDFPPWVVTFLRQNIVVHGHVARDQSGLVSRASFRAPILIRCHVGAYDDVLRHVGYRSREDRHVFPCPQELRVM